MFWYFYFLWKPHKKEHLYGDEKNGKKYTIGIHKNYKSVLKENYGNMLMCSDVFIISNEYK